MKYRYDPEQELSYELYECETCGVRFSGGGPALHYAECPVKSEGYNSCTLVFGPNQVAEVKKRLREYDKWYRLTIDVLREQFPELLEEGVK